LFLHQSQKLIYKSNRLAGKRAYCGFSIFLS